MHKVTVITNLLFLLTFSISSSVLAASGKIEGYVRDAETRNALIGANVFLVGTSMGAVSDDNGRYVISNVPVGKYTVRASYLGYESKELTISVTEGSAAKRDFGLKAVGIKGKGVVITAQAAGQNSAINQQLSSDKIMNVVSAAKIQELPDANAAESIGRLPGVSLVRDGGEASQVVIRGMAPQYNEITIDGVQVPPNVSSSRAVDLSNISSSMLGGIEVIKAITPDMDAAAMGGTVNLELPEARQSRKGVLVTLLSEGGYNDLQNKYSNYKFVGTSQSRLFDSRFGIFAQASVEGRNLTANELGASYSLNAPKLGVPNPVYMNDLTLTDIPRYRRRYGATVVMDYRLSDFKIDFMNFVSSGNTNTQIRSEDYSLVNNTHSYTTTDEQNILNIITNLIDVKKRFALFSVDAKMSHSYSESSVPNALTFSFSQTPVGLASAGYERLNPQAIPPLAKNDLSQTYLQTALQSSSLSRNRQFTGSLDFQSHINFSRDITSVLKFGGAYKYTIKSYNYTSQNNRLYISGADSVTQAILNAFPWMTKTVPNASYQLPMTLFVDPSFSYGNFLGGAYPMGAPLNVNLMHQVMNVINQAPQPNSYDYYTDVATNDYSSTTNNYSGNERESAAYVMSTVDFGQMLTLLPGVRYQQLTTSYTAPRGTQTPLQYDYSDTTIDETHGYWLPMVHLIIRPLSWLQVHLAYTNTLTYPSFNAITPRINIGFTSVVWNNYALKPGRSTNYDAIFSVYNNAIGLFTIDGFLKHISDLIFPISTYIINPADYPGIPSTTKGEPLVTSINDPNKVDLWGTEVDWETHFWYLPGPLSGLVLSVNYTHIFSRAKYPRVTVTTIYLPKYQQIVNNSFYTDRMIYQPDDIANLAVGYDFKGFSVRVSMLYQSNVFQQANFWPELRVDGAKYVRWDFALKQNLPWLGLRAFFDLNNINSARDLNINQGSSFPESEQVYGLTADMGFETTF